MKRKWKLTNQPWRTALSERWIVSIYAQYAQKFPLYFTAVTVNCSLHFGLLRTMWVSNPKYKTRSEAGFSRTAANENMMVQGGDPLCEHM